MSTTTFGGAKYFITIIDDYFQYTTIYFFQYKYKVFEKFHLKKAFVKNQTRAKIKILQIDNGGEFCNHQFNDFVKFMAFSGKILCHTF
jgi:hypothetical protein